MKMRKKWKSYLYWIKDLGMEQFLKETDHKLIIASFFFLAVIVYPNTA